MKSLKVLSVVLLVFLPAGRSQSANGCNDDFQKKIKERIWDAYGMPKHILQTGSKAGIEYIVWTTQGYYPEDTICAYTEFGNGGKTIRLFTVTKTAMDSPERDPLKEYDSIVEEEDTHIKRIHIYSQDGIVVWYKCIDGGENGPVEIALKVKYNSYDATKVNAVKELIENKLEVSLKDSHPHDCKVPATKENKHQDHQEEENVKAH